MATGTVQFQFGTLATPPPGLAIMADAVNDTDHGAGTAQYIKLMDGATGGTLKAAVTSLGLAVAGTFQQHGTSQSLGTFQQFGTSQVLGSVQTVGTSQGLGTFQPLAGSVHIASSGTLPLGSVQVLGSVQSVGTTQTKEVRSGANFGTRIAGTIGNLILLAANPNRLGAMFYQEAGGGALFLKLGSLSGTVDYTVQVAPNGYYETPYNYTGTVSGIWQQAGGTVQITEVS